MLYANLIEGAKDGIVTYCTHPRKNPDFTRAKCNLWSDYRNALPLWRELMSSVFDPDSFMDQSVDGANDTTFEPVPVGEYVSIIEKVDFRSFTSKDGEDRVIMDVTHDLQDNDVREQLGRDKVTVRQSIFLDTTPSGTIDLGKGKNVGLGKLRAALNQNNPGWTPRSLVGAGPLKVTVGHRQDRNNPENVFAEVKAVGAFE